MVRGPASILMSAREGCTPVKNHGIPQNIIDRAIEVSKDFFALPLQTKLEVHTPSLPFEHSLIKISVK
jgi:isopenicillin N synthase-like dioxygenase